MVANDQHILLTTHLGSTNRGGSGSQILSSSDGTKYVVKFTTNPQGTRILANEFVANELARACDLPCPRGYFAFLSQPLIPSLCAIAGPHYATELMPNLYTNPPTALMRQATNKECFPGIIVFDILTNNHDRNNGGNFLIQTDSNGHITFVMIDHGHCFGPNWTTESLRASRGTWCRNCFPEMVESVEDLKQFVPFESKLASITDGEIKHLVATIPTEWNVTSQEKEELSAFLIYRKDHVRQIILNSVDIFHKLRQGGKS